MFPRTFLPKEDSNMKKPWSILMIAFLAATPLGAQARQNTDSAHERSSDAPKTSKKLTNISGKVSGDGRTFTADKDNKIWMVSNPEMLGGTDGRHVRVKGQLDVAQSQIRIVSVRAIAEQQAGVKLDDAAFRR
jgi:hypothetical protein